MMDPKATTNNPIRDNPQAPPKSITIASQNVRGLNDHMKAGNIFKTMLTNCKADIFLLQETHLFEVKQEPITKQWQALGGGETFYSPTTTINSGGTAIFFREHKGTLNVSRFGPSKDGRSILLDIGYHGFDMTILNVYAPNDGKERETFFTSLYPWFCTKSKAIPILGGDFNCVENPILDRESDRKTKTAYDNEAVRGINELSMLTKALGICDAWRTQNPTISKQFTCDNKREQGSRCQARIDRFYIPTHMCFNSTTTFLPHGISDHQLVTVQIKTNTIPHAEPGPGYWKLNTSLLENQEYVNIIRKVIENIPPGNTAMQTWETCKQRIQTESLALSNRLAWEKQRAQKQATEKLEKLIKRSSQNQAEIDGLKSTIKEEIRHKNQSFFLHAKVEELELDEEPSAYFYYKLRQNKASSTITSLKLNTDSQGSESTIDPQIILKQIRTYYTDLYAKADTDHKLQTQMLNNIHNTLSQTTKQDLDTKIDTDQMEKAVFDMHNRKSPGPDGIPAEFYKRFWPELAPLMLNMANESYENGILPGTLRTAYVTLIYKKGDRESLDNWRPISLLNVDYKIIAKTLSQRLTGALGEIINPEQTAGIPGRTIQDNLYTIRDAIQYANDQNQPFLCLSLDQEKAFDRVDHVFLQKVLTKFGFGPYFRKWITTLYTQRTACYMNNKQRTLPVDLLRGLFQGCPLSFVLYVLVAEVLSTTIQALPDIQGLDLPTPSASLKQKPPQLLLSTYADDTTVFINPGRGALKALQHLFAAFKNYEKATGAKFNQAKTMACFFGPGNHDHIKHHFPLQ